MRLPKKSIILITLLSFLWVGAIDPRAAWTPLLDENLSQWGMYLGFHINDGYKGELPVDERGNPRQPFGYNVNTSNVFTVSKEEGQPVLRISGEIYGCIFTKEEFRDYHLKLKVKWGEKKWEPRKEKLRDTGICYHSVGECGADYWRAWMTSQEFQIMEGHFGDYWNIGGSAIDVRAFLPEGTMNPVANAGQPFVSIGTGTENPGFCLRSEDRESPKGQWTQVELICFQGKSLHIINGQVVMVLQNSRYLDHDKVIPLTSGKIQLQSEGAEVYYKDIQIRKIDSLPPGYSGYLNGQ